MGNPSGATTDKAKADNYLIKRKQYALSYNNSTGTPNWVSWNLSKKWLGKTRRKNPFAPDPALPEGFLCVRPNDYRASGFDRGHLCPSADRSASQEDQDATFYMSNMVPQSGDLNRKTWEKLESYCRDQARDDKELFIVAGAAGRGGWGEAGYKTFLHGSGGKIVVPAHCWKVVLILPAGVTDPKKVTTENAKVAAVIMPNLQGLDTAWRTYSTSVRDVEELTGYTFFSALPADVAKELKDRKADTRGKVASKEPGTKMTKKGSKGGTAGTLPAFEEGCVIGNKRSKKYHVPGGRGYAAAKNSKNAVFFRNAEDAKKAGYTPVKR
jgi:endonuclease G